jgi:hypothetical protein
VLQVGPGQQYTMPSAAAAAAQNGDTVHIAAGDYRGDVAIWRANDLTVCGIGGRARLFADGRNAEGKGIWVIKGSPTLVDSVEFHDARVPDENGAGIRQEGAVLTVRNCAFVGNENGILSNGGGSSVVTIERCEFTRNGFGDGYSHNIYIGRGGRLVVLASLFREARVGHNLKSRARENVIENSYFADGASGNSSYLLDFPDGGAVLMRGNLLHKGPNAQNSAAISYGTEGQQFTPNTLRLVHNTLVSTYPGGAFMQVVSYAQDVSLVGNLLASNGNAALVRGGFPLTSIVQQSNVVTTAANVPGASTLQFWPVASIQPQLSLSAVLDAAYVSDSPQPFALRTLAGIGGARIGALQAQP